MRVVPLWTTGANLLFSGKVKSIWGPLIMAANFIFKDVSMGLGLMLYTHNAF